MVAFAKEKRSMKNFEAWVETTDFGPVLFVKTRAALSMFILFLLECERVGFEEKQDSVSVIGTKLDGTQKQTIAVLPK